MATNALIRTDLPPDVLAVYDRLTPLKEALGIEKLTDGEVQLFAMVAAHTGLDPFTKQIYAIKRGNKVTHQTGIDGYRSSAERTREYRGTGPAQYELCDCGDEGSPRDHPRIARVEVFRAYPEGIRAQVGEARWHELKPEHRKPQNAYDYLDEMWWRMPFNQLAKCAEANGLRKAFPRVLGDVYIAEEMEQARVIDAEPPAPRPSLAERAAQRAAEVEPLVLAPMTPSASARYVNPEEIAEGARAIERDGPETRTVAEAINAGMPWTRERLHDAAKRAGLVKLAGQVYEAVRGDRLAADLTEEDWAAMARELGLEP